MRKRSSWLSGRGCVPRCSAGFWVATTKKGLGSACVRWSTDTWRSSIASSSALCVRGPARLISSASSTWVNTGPGWKTKASRERSNTLTPSRSLGMRSEVNCTRAKRSPSDTARAWASVVLPTPGTSSISR